MPTETPALVELAGILAADGPGGDLLRTRCALAGEDALPIVRALAPTRPGLEALVNGGGRSPFPH